MPTSSACWRKAGNTTTQPATATSIPIHGIRALPATTLLFSASLDRTARISTEGESPGGLSVTKQGRGRYVFMSKVLPRRSHEQTSLAGGGGAAGNFGRLRRSRLSSQLRLPFARRRLQLSKQLLLFERLLQ